VKDSTYTPGRDSSAIDSDEEDEMPIKKQKKK